MDSPTSRRRPSRRCKKSLEALKADLGKVRTGRAHTGILDHITVDYYGTQTPLNQVANLTLLDARTIGVAPWEKKMVPAIEKAIRDSDLGLNPATQGDADPRADAGADRGAPQGADQGGQARGRERPGRGAQPAARRQPPPQGAAQEEGESPRTTSAARRTRCRS